MKRFTETTKWRDPWYRKLSSKAKLLWQWLLDNCDNAGVIDFDTEAATFDIGETIDEKHLSEIASRLQRLGNGKFWIKRFIPYQYGPSLSISSVPHVRVIELLSYHGLNYPIKGNPSTTQPPTLVHRVETTAKTRQDKTSTVLSSEGRGGVGEKEANPKEQIKLETSQQEIGKSGKSRNTELIGELKNRIGVMFGRNPSDEWAYAEECLLIEISRRANCLAEIKSIVAYQAKKPKFFAQSVAALLNDWTKYLDRSRMPETPPDEPAKRSEQNWVLYPGNTGCPGV